MAYNPAKMDLDHNPIAIGYQAGGCIGLILGAFLGKTWLGYAIVAFSCLFGGLLVGLIAYAITTGLARRRGAI